MDLKKRTDKVLEGFHKYCENKDCDRICPSDVNERCFAEYVAKVYEKEENDEGLEINGIICERDMKLTARQIEDLFFDFLESLGLQFGGITNYVKVYEEDEESE